MAAIIGEAPATHSQCEQAGQGNLCPAHSNREGGPANLARLELLSRLLRAVGHSGLSGQVLWATKLCRQQSFQCGIRATIHVIVEGELVDAPA